MQEYQTESISLVIGFKFFNHFQSIGFTEFKNEDNFIIFYKVTIEVRKIFLTKFL